MELKQDILDILAVRLRMVLFKLDYDRLMEIRLRSGGPLMILYDNSELFLGTDGEVVKKVEDAFMVEQKDIKETLEYVSNYSRYAYEDEIKQGFITIRGGHRIGLAGKTLVCNGQIENLRNISFLNIRLSHQKKGCGKKILPYIVNKNAVLHTLIISPPGCGKTTLLRDVVRILSDGENLNQGLTVGVVDERSEIGACYLGVPQNDVGIRTDVLDCCPKSQGMLMLIRSMAPKVVAVDEIGNRDDVEAIEYVINCGCKILATVHGNSIDDIRNRPVLRKLVEEKVFERYIVLNNRGRVGNVAQIFDAQGNLLYMDGRNDR